MPKQQTNGEYKVGYKMPPKEHQFKPGNPGGPGRPRKNTLEKFIEEELYKNDGEKAKKIAAELVMSAAYGNHRATNIVINLAKK